MRRKDAITTITTVLALALSVGGFFFVNQTNAGAGAVQMLGNMNESIGALIEKLSSLGDANTMAAGFMLYAITTILQSNLPAEQPEAVPIGVLLGRMVPT